MTDRPLYKELRRVSLDSWSDSNGWASLLRMIADHPMHGLYSGLVQTTSTTSPENAMTDDFLFLTLNQTGKKIAIRKSSVHTFFDSDHHGTIVEYTSDSACVEESFNEVCRLLGIDTHQQESQP